MILWNGLKHPRTYCWSKCTGNANGVRGKPNKRTRLFDFRMKTAIILLVCLPFLFAKTANDEVLEVYRRMTPEQRMDGEYTIHIKH